MHASTSSPKAAASRAGVSARICGSTMLVLGLVCLPLGAFAQTVDGVGGRTQSDQDRIDAERARVDADSMLDLYDYQPRHYQVSARTWVVYAPAFLLGAFFDANTNQWSDGVRNFSYGLDFTTRIPDKFDLRASIDWANMRTADGFWLENDDPVRDADFTRSNLSLINADVSLLWFTSLGRKEAWQVYYGFGLGVGVVLGQFEKSDIDIQRCGWDTDQRNSNDVGLIDACVSENPSPLPHVNFFERERDIPPVIPVVAATLGLRYLITDNVSMSLEMGWKSIYTYTGLSIGYYWNPL